MSNEHRTIVRPYRRDAGFFIDLIANRVNRQTSEHGARFPHTQLSAAFPHTFEWCGYLDVRTKPEKPWKRRYFVIKNNFLLSASTPRASKLDRVIPLEGSKFEPNTEASDIEFEIIIRKHKLYFKTETAQQCIQWKNAMEKASKLKIKDIYRFLYNLGIHTSSSTNVVAAKHRTNGEESAIKIIDKRKYDKKALIEHIKLLKKIDNAYVVKLYDIIETKKYVYIVMEKCEGVPLFIQLDNTHYAKDDVCCNIMHQIATAVHYMHSMGIIHRDLKPENILCVKPNTIDTVKICDFGMSMISNNSKDIEKKEFAVFGFIRQCQESLSYKTNTFYMIPGSITCICFEYFYCKTRIDILSYPAPEILTNYRYDESVDFWSIGIIMFILLCGYLPFGGGNDAEITKSILNDDLQFDDKDWKHVSVETRCLVKGLLSKNPSKRLSCIDVMKLEWNMCFDDVRTKLKETVTNRQLAYSQGVEETVDEQKTNTLNNNDD